MSDHVILLSVPGLRGQDVSHMPRLSAKMREGDSSEISPSFPCVTCSVQMNMVTGCTPQEHGVIGNGFYWREKNEFEMWTAWNEVVQRPQIWDLLHERSPGVTSAAWFPLLIKGCGADYICTFAPIHNPDGSESLWCYTKPTELYGDLRDTFGHFPLQHFWGPLANIKSSQWIADSAVEGAKRFRPNFFYIYLPHLDYAAQKTGPDSDAATQALADLDEVLGSLFERVESALSAEEEANVLWIVASEYTISPVNHVLYPNRLLRDAGLLSVQEDEHGERLDTGNSQAWALADHQFSHIFVRDREADVVRRVQEVFQGQEGVAEVLAGEDLAKYDLAHERAGDVVVISEPTSWQAYYYWQDDERAPDFAHTVDIHRKPGYDPVELFFDPATKSIPLNANLVQGSHGAPPWSDSQRGAILASQPGVLPGGTLTDTDVADLVLRQFGV